MIDLPAQKVSPAFLRLAILSVIHALLVFALWAAMFWANVESIPAKPWLVFAWLWLSWPVALSVHRDRSFFRVAIPVAIGFTALAPCATTIYVLTSWTIWGFAP